MGISSHEKHTECRICKVPANYPTWNHKRIPGKWSEDQDLVETWPCEWRQKPSMHHIRVNGLCQHCHSVHGGTDAQ